MEASEPTVYLIHNLLTSAECDAMVRQAAPLVTTVQASDALQLTTDAWKRENVARVMLWQGLLHSPSRKAIEERIEQVTGFPAAHHTAKAHLTGGSHAAHLRGLTGRQVTLDLDGGTLAADWRDDGVWLTGPVATAFHGVLP